MNNSQLHLDNYKERRKNVIIRSILILFLLSSIILLIWFAPTYYDLMHQSFAEDGTTMMMLIFPYMVLGISFSIRLILEVFDHEYVFRSFWSARQSVKAKGLI